MKKPTRMDVFDALYALAADDGREDALFGTSIGLARPAYERTLIGSEYPTVYLEFPLTGEPGFDLLSVYGDVEPGARFAEGAGFGYQAMFDWFSGACATLSAAPEPDSGALDTEEPSDGEPDSGARKPADACESSDVCVQTGAISCGIELDTSDGETERAGVYLQQRKRHELVTPFLESVGEGARAQSYIDVLKRMPEGWPSAYVGLFPGRAGTPLRIGGYMSRGELARCAESTAHLAERFRTIGFTAFDEDMLDRCTEFMSMAPSVDFQFDIMPDGSLGDTFGLSLSFNETKPRQAHDCMESGYGAHLMRILQDWGLADDRWRLIADAAFARHVPYEKEDGSLGHLALCVLFNYAKVKFTGGQPRPAKFYFQCRASDLEL